MNRIDAMVGPKAVIVPLNVLLVSAARESSVPAGP
jgi:hypothetical protein